MTRTFAYCRWTEIVSAFLAGWRFHSSAPGSHEVWSAIVEWPRESDPVNWRRGV